MAKSEKKAPTMFKAKGQSNKFYVNKAIQDYIKAEAELKTIIKLNCVDEDTLSKMKESVQYEIDNLADELSAHLSGNKEALYFKNHIYEELLNKLEEVKR